MTKKSFFLLVLTAVIWGFAFAAQRVGGNLLGGFAFNGIRYMLGAFSLIPVCLIFEKKDREPVVARNTFLYGVITGVILFTASALQQEGVNLTQSSGKSGFITGLYLVLVPILAVIFRKKVPPIVWLSAVIAVGGLYLVSCSGGEQFGWGDGVLLIGAVFWALHILVIDRVGLRVYSLRYSLIQFLTAGIINQVIMWIMERPALENVLAAAIPLLYSGVMSTGVAYTCQILGQKNADPSKACLILSTESVFSAVGGAVFLHEKMHGLAYLGCALIFGAIMLCQIDFKPLFRKKRRGFGETLDKAPKNR